MYLDKIRLEEIRIKKKSTVDSAIKTFLYDIDTYFDKHS